MGCVICNILAGIPPVIDGDNEQHANELKEELCNDIAIGHPEMVTRINKIVVEAAMRTKQ